MATLYGYTGSIHGHHIWGYVDKTSTNLYATSSRVPKADTSTNDTHSAAPTVSHHTISAQTTDVGTRYFNGHKTFRIFAVRQIKGLECHNIFLSGSQVCTHIIGMKIEVLLLLVQTALWIRAMVITSTQNNSYVNNWMAIQTALLLGLVAPHTLCPLPSCQTDALL
jgi:hypothetical protein